MDLHVDERERLQPSTEAAVRATYTLGHCTHTPMRPRQERDNPIRLTQSLGAQHNRLIPKHRHAGILPAAEGQQASDTHHK